MADRGGGAAGPYSFSSSGDGTDSNRFYSTTPSSSSSSPATLDGAFLLQLLRNPPQSQPQHHPQSHQQREKQQQQPPPPSSLPHETLSPHRDPAVAAVGPTYPFAPHNFIRPHRNHQETPSHLSSSSSFPPGFSRGQSTPPRFPPHLSGPGTPQVFPADFLRNSPTQHHYHHHKQQQQQPAPPRDSSSRCKALDSGVRGRANASGNLFAAEEESGGYHYKSNSSMTHTTQQQHQHQQHFTFDRSHRHAPIGNHRNAITGGTQRHGMGEQNHQRMPPPASTAMRTQRMEWVSSKQRQDGQHNSNRHDVDRREYNPREGNGGGPSASFRRESLSRQGPGTGDVQQTSQRTRQFDQSGLHGMRRNHGSGSSEDSDRGRILEDTDDFGSSSKSGFRDLDDSADQLEETLMLGEDTSENHIVKHSNTSRGKDVRIDLFRGHNVSSQRIRIRRRELECRYDIDSLTPLFLAIYKSLIPVDEEKGKQKQLLLSLEKLVNKEWPNAQLHLYGSCANSFGVSNSDIDICLAIDDTNMSKSEILLKLAEILESDNLQNVQALTHARVPIVKMMDPVTGISCDICINNLLAVANTKLLRDYAQIDERLRQLAFIVKHWAKSRGVNETYRGTLSSYAYVLMCIHFLQQRKPAILPCLQEMEATYVVNVDGTQCAYFDQVDRLRSFGAQNNESIARLLWGFFHYWAYHHDYTSGVISVRTGRNISKTAKDWTRRIGNDRHLICIEDPFETSHDLGRVVDKYSIKILREEFERAADILQYDSNPSVTLFEPYVPRSLPNGLQPE